MNSYNTINCLKLPKIINQRFHNTKHTSKIPKNPHFINALKLSKINGLNSENNNNNKKIIKNRNKNMLILNLSQKKKKKEDKKKNTSCSSIIIPSYSFKNIFNVIKKNKLKKSFSCLHVNTIEKEKPNLESNFMKLKNESNIYTSNANYITNKKMIIIDKYFYDNNVYKPDRLGLFDMSDFKRPKMRFGREIGKIYYNHNKYRISKDDNINNINNI
jgi:hypothetical protein